MGWNNVNPSLSADCTKEQRGFEVLFFTFLLLDAFEESDVEATANYDGEYVCSVRKGNIFGVQFHPEKSHHFGMQLLKNFAEI